MSWIWIFFGLFLDVSGLILPMTEQDGSVDMSSVLYHITLLEQTVSDFHKKTTHLEADLQVTKSELKRTKADLKNQQRRSDADISSLKDELSAVKAEVIMSSNEHISAKSEIASLKMKFLALQTCMNQTVLDSTSHDVKSNIADIKSVNYPLEMTNSSLKTFVTKINDCNRNVTDPTTSEINMNKSDMANIRRNVSGLDGTKHIATQISEILQTTKEELETMKTSLQDQQKQSTSIYKYINTQLKTIKSDLDMKTTPVFFSAYLSSPSNITAKLPVKFDEVQYNAGNGYNNTTGQFTSPVSGTYMFSAQIEMYCYNKSQETYIQIMKSRAYMAAGYGKSSSSIDDITIPVTTVMYVGQGEEVWVQPDDDIQVYGYTSTHFVGTLVSAV